VPVLLSGLLVALAIFFWASVFLLAPVGGSRGVALSDILTAAGEKQVVSSTLYDVDNRVEIRTLGGQTLFAAYPHSAAVTGDLISTLARSGPVRVDAQTGKATLLFVRDYLLPVFVLAALFGLVLTAGRGEGGAREYTQFSRVRSGAKLKTRHDRAAFSAIGFASVAGCGYAVTELAEIVDYLRDSSRFVELGAVPPKGVLLVGPPGTGKTLLARAVAGQADVPFFSISGSEFVESLVGVGAARVRDLFRQVRAQAPAILFVDELDAAGRKRGAGVGGGNDEREQTLNQMLVEMDGFSPSSGVVVIGATNRPDILDPALLRPGRFDRIVTVDKPDVAGRFELLRLYATGRPTAGNVDLDALARRTVGLTGADIANLWREAALLAVRAQATAITQEHLDEAVLRVVVGPSRPIEALSTEERRIVAVHEAGHAVSAAALGLVAGLDRVSVARRGVGLGHVILTGEDRLLLRQSDLLARMAASLGGRAAEQIVLGETSTGCEADIERATEIASEMAGRYGMSEGVGPVRIHVKDHEVFLGRDLGELAQVSPETLGRLDAEIRRLVESADDRARSVVAANLAVLLELAGRLEDADTVAGPELAGLLSRVAAGTAATPARTPAGIATPANGRRRRAPES